MHAFVGHHRYLVACITHNIDTEWRPSADGEDDKQLHVVDGAIEQNPEGRNS